MPPLRWPFSDDKSLLFEVVFSPRDRDAPFQASIAMAWRPVLTLADATGSRLAPDPTVGGRAVRRRCDPGGWPEPCGRPAKPVGRWASSAGRRPERRGYPARRVGQPSRTVGQLSKRRDEPSKRALQRSGRWCQDPERRCHRSQPGCQSLKPACQRPEPARHSPMSPLPLLAAAVSVDLP